MKETPFPELIRKYLDGRCTPEEREEVETWYDRFEKDADLLEFLSETEREMLRAILFKNIKENIRRSLPVHDGQKHPWRRYASGIAAMLVAGIGLMWILLTIAKTSPTDGSVNDRQVVVENKEKNIQRTSLPDGSIAWLHPNSSLTYPEVFKAGLRTVVMTGEVFFEVAPDSLTPFVVYSGEVRTKVLGTSFRIRAYATDPFTYVSVLTGKVSVKRIVGPLSKIATRPDTETGEEVVLLPDESILFSGLEQQFNKEKGTKGLEMDMWKKSNVSFNNVPVKEVLRVLNQTYNVQIVVAEEKINKYLLRADFTGMNLPDVLEILEHSLGLTYEMEHQVIKLKMAGE